VSLLLSALSQSAADGYFGGFLFFWISVGDPDGESRVNELVLSSQRSSITIKHHRPPREQNGTFIHIFSDSAAVKTSRKYDGYDGTDELTV